MTKLKQIINSNKFLLITFWTLIMIMYVYAGILAHSSWGIISICFIIIMYIASLLSMSLYYRKYRHIAGIIAVVLLLIIVLAQYFIL